MGRWLVCRMHTRSPRTPQETEAPYRKVKGKLLASFTFSLTHKLPSYNKLSKGGKQLEDSEGWLWEELPLWYDGMTLSFSWDFLSFFFFSVCFRTSVESNMYNELKVSFCMKTMSYVVALQNTWCISLLCCRTAGWCPQSASGWCLRDWCAPCCLWKLIKALSFPIQSINVTSAFGWHSYFKTSIEVTSMGNGNGVILCPLHLRELLMVERECRVWRMTGWAYTQRCKCEHWTWLIWFACVLSLDVPTWKCPVSLLEVAQAFLGGFFLLFHNSLSLQLSTASSIGNISAHIILLVLMIGILGAV